MDNILYINEIFYSIQGESTYQGWPCIFIRLAGCNLRCKWCDTTYAFYDGEKKTFEEVLEHIRPYKTNLVEITGGEPLLQKNIIPFMEVLLSKRYKVLLETSGSLPIDKVPKEVLIIMDIKCPDSGEVDKNRWENLEFLKPKDEIKFVIASRNDYEWAKNVCNRYELTKKFTVHFSPVWEYNIAREMVEWILDDNLPVRVNLQLHKFLWNGERGK
jgi:7-carboxy-7-deazaguanine synthase